MKLTRARILWILSAALLYVGSCSINHDIAGGAGAGNPAIISVIAKGVDSSRAAMPPALFEEHCRADSMHAPLSAFCPALPGDTGVFVTITDHGKMPVKVNGVFITARHVSFPLPDNVTNKDITAPLYCIADTMFLDGPFVFDVLRGTSAPATRFIMPNGLYEYAGLYIGAAGGNQSSTTPCTEYQILLTGTFLFRDTVRNISIYILCDEKIFFPAAGDGVLLDGSDSADLTITLDEQEWLDSINIKGCLNNGVIYLDEQGNLSIYDNPGGTGPDAQLAARIRANIWKSGIFRRHLQTADNFAGIQQKKKKATRD